MSDDRLINEMARAEKSIRAYIQDYTEKILTLAEEYRALGIKFTFDKNNELDKKVNALLVELSDAVLEDMNSAAERLLEEEEDKDSILAWARIKTNAQNTIDKYSSHLKFFLEGWLAIGFANKLSRGDLLLDILTYIDNPYISPLWKKAFEDGAKYASKIIREGGWRWGSGTPLSPAKGMSLTESNFINTAFQKGVVNGFVRKGAIGYRVHRGSGYDCSYCDSLCVGIHPLTEIVLPAHLRCCCYCTPVFEGEE